MTTIPPTVSQFVFTRNRAAARTRNNLGGLARYEAQKLIWARANPGATPEQYTQAMRAIALECGV